MPDREKVISHLNDCMEASRRDNTLVFVRKDIVADAIVLLKEQQEQIDRLIVESASNAEMAEGLTAMLKEQEPVRCGDCAYALFKEGLVQDGNIFCTKPFTERWQAIKPNNWFCADGERKNDGHQGESEE